MCKMVYQSDVDKLVKSHIYNWVKPKIWNKDINDVDWKNVKDTVYLDQDVKLHGGKIMTISLSCLMM